MSRVWLATLCLFVWPTGPAWAADSDGNYLVWGKGGTACVSYTRARSEGDDKAHRDYLMGFITATNLLMDETYSISGSKPLSDLLLWLDDYCEENPMSSYEGAISGLAAENFEQRKRRSGSQW